jgi:hypothetical protein
MDSRALVGCRSGSQTNASPARAFLAHGAKKALGMLFQAPIELRVEGNTAQSFIAKAQYRRAVLPRDEFVERADDAAGDATAFEAEIVIKVFEARGRLGISSAGLTVHGGELVAQAIDVRPHAGQVLVIRKNAFENAVATRDITQPALVEVFASNEQEADAEVVKRFLRPVSIFSTWLWARGSVWSSNLSSSSKTKMIFIRMLEGGTRRRRRTKSTTSSPGLSTLPVVPYSSLATAELAKLRSSMKPSLSSASAWRFRFSTSTSASPVR